LGRHASGDPAITRHDYGSGVGWSVGTHLSSSAYDRAFASLLVSIARASGAVPLVEAPLAADGLPRVWARRRVSGSRTGLSLTSTAPDATPVTLVGLVGDAVDALSGEHFRLTPTTPVVEVPAMGSRLLIVDGAHGSS
ncbi:MAG TPA: hypothetical protein VGS21_05830, partial [Acidimicrobiales bacterium]|nr:hypothetical protein [Acidimicrobiales bacterium]